MKEMRPFEFDPMLHRSVGNYLADRIDYSTKIVLPPYELLDFITPEAEERICGELGRPIGKSLLLYYFLLAHRRMDPAFFPPQDLMMLMANLAGLEPSSSQATLEDIRLLPAAILLTDRNWQIRLPPDAAAYRERLECLLKPSSLTDQAASPDCQTFYICGDPRQDEMGEGGKKGRLAYYLTNWDFLGVKGNEYYRRFWLENISAVLQIPRLKRQGISAYPAIIRCGDASSIRMAQIKDVKVGDGGLDQKLAISLMTGAPNGLNSMEVEKAKIVADSGCNLTPAVWLTGNAGSCEAYTLKLGDCAQIIRCQLPRVKYKDVSLNYGPQADGSFVAREAGMAALQAQCGFLLDEGGEQVNLDFKRKDNQFKYLLKANDILFAFRGTTESLGKVGFVAQEPEIPSISGTAFYIIRSLGILNPVWLYWCLQTEEMRSAILAKASGTSMLNISVDDTKNLSVRRPEAEELATILKAHAQISMQMLTLSKVGKTISEEVEKIRASQN